MMTMTIERVRAFNGLDVLVARDEGLFAAEGLDLRIAPAAVDAPSTATGTLTEPVSIHAGWRKARWAPSRSGADRWSCAGLAS
jgi:hypothetical protein